MANTKPAQTHQEFTAPELKMAVRIPSPPPHLDEINRLLDDPKATMEQIGELIHQDAGLTASLYRILAKPIYGLRKPPETVAQAISLVGLTTLANLVKGLSLQTAIYGDSAFLPWFWERANDIAALASAIAKRQRTVCNVYPEHAHLAALFLDCGVPILVQHSPKYEDSFMSSFGYHWPDLLAEDSRFDTDHAVVGHLAARHWHLPDYVCQAIRWHHEPINVEQKAATLVAILQTAMHIHNVYAREDDGEWTQYAEQALEEIGVTKDGLKEFEEDIHDRALGQ